MECEHLRQSDSCSICNPEAVYNRYRRGAKARGIKFELTLAQFKAITQLPCFYCDKYSDGRGVDREKNDEGYTVSNSRSCCSRCNRWKSNESVDVFLGHARQISDHQAKLRKQKLLEKQASVLGTLPVAAQAPEQPPQAVVV